MIEDVVYRCDGCSARVVVLPEAQEEAERDGTLGLAAEKVDDPRDYAFGKYKGSDYDRVRVEVPAGWQRRHGVRGLLFLHLCPDCLRKGLMFG